METVVTVVVVFVLVTIGLAVGTAALVMRVLRVRNRVAPSQRANPPLVWLLSPSPAARLHRRMQAVLASLRLALAGRAGVGLGLDDVCRDVDARAIELDRQLAVADRSPRPARRRMVRELRAEVHELEAIAERAVRLTRSWGDGAGDRGLGAVRERLDALESALRELDGIEQLHALPDFTPERQRLATPLRGDRVPRALSRRR